MTHPARAGRAPEDAVRGPPGGTEGELGGLGGGDSDETCFSVVWSLPEVVPRPRKPAEAFIHGNLSSHDALMSVLDQREEGVLN